MTKKYLALIVMCVSARAANNAHQSPENDLSWPPVLDVKGDDWLLDKSYEVEVEKGLASPGNGIFDEKYLHSDVNSVAPDTEHLLIFPTELGYPPTQDGSIPAHRIDFDVFAGPLQQEETIKERSERRLVPWSMGMQKIESSRAGLFPRSVQEIAEAASRLSNFVTEGTVNSANIVNNVHHQILEWWLGMMSIADQRLQNWADVDVEVLKRLLASHETLLNAWGALGDQLIRMSGQTLAFLEEQRGQLQDDSFLHHLLAEESPPYIDTGKRVETEWKTS